MRHRHHVAAVLVFAAISFSACDLRHEIFGISEEEAKRAAALVLNVYVDTSPFVTHENVACDTNTRVLSYTNVEGTFRCEWDFSEGRVEQTYTGYRPLFSEYSITGNVIWTGYIEDPAHGVFYAATSAGALALSGGAVSTLTFELALHCPTGDASTAELNGTVRADRRGAEFSADDLDIVELMIANAAALAQVYRTAAD